MLSSRTIVRATYVFLHFLRATIKKTKQNRRNTQNLNNIFYLIQYIPNIFI